MKILLRGLVMAWWLLGGICHVPAQDSNRRWEIGDVAVARGGATATVTRVYDHQGRQVVIAKSEDGQQRWWYGDWRGPRGKYGVASMPSSQDPTPEQFFWWAFRHKHRSR